MTSDVHDATDGVTETALDDEQSTRRIAELYATDPEFAAAAPLPAVVDAAHKPGLRLAEILQTLFTGYGDRPALGYRARELATDEGGRTVTRLLPRFDTLTYAQVWSRVQAVAAALRHNFAQPIYPGDAVATIGFASPDYLTLDLVCAYLGLVSVPLQHNAPVSRLAPILAEVEPRILTVSAEYLDLAVESVRDVNSVSQLVVFDHHPEVDDHRDALARAREQLAGKGIAVTTLDAIADEGAGLPAEPIYTADHDQRLAMILYTSGSTGAPKGAMYTEAMVARLWTMSFITGDPTPVINVNFMPLNHLGGRIPISTAVQNGGTSYFVPESDMSTLFEDLALVRPTELGLVPRVADMLYQHHLATVDRLVTQGADELTAEKQAGAELREQVLGGRVITGFVSTAPLAAEMRAFLDITLGAHIVDGYGLTETGAVTRDGVIVRPPVIDYKLIDVPELGYFSTDKPYPRGELLVRSQTLTPGYYKRPEVTASVFDRDGYYHTGDVMAETAPDHLVYVDRRNNVLKLAQGEFVAVANLEAVFSGAALVRQIFVYGNSERSFLLAVVVPTPEALEQYDPAALKAALADSLQRTARDAELQSYEVPADFIVETEPFSAANGLLSGVGKLLRPNLKDRYGQRLEQMYADIAATQANQLRELRRAAATQPVIDTLTQAAATILGTGSEVASDAHFTDLGGDSLSALTLSNLLSDFFGFEVPVGTIVNPATNLAQLAQHIEAQRTAGDRRPSFTTVHGADATEIRASELTLDKFIDAETLRAAPGLPKVTTEPRTVLLSGANGWLGRFLTLQWLERLAPVGGTLITIVRGRDDAAARARLTQAYDTDPELSRRFAELADRHLRVVAGDIGDPNLGLTPEIWHRLAAEVDLVVHPAALVNHVLPYRQLFGPNVVGTAEVIKLALTERIKPVTYLSTVSVAMGIPDFEEDGDIRTVSPVRPLDGGYANGYGNSKWAGEVLLREAHDLCGLPVATFRSDMILAHPRYRGQVNVPDMFTRLLLSLLITGVAPRSFYIGDGERPRAHYPGLTVDFVAEAVTTLGAQQREGYVSYDVMNPHDDGISLDVFVDWLIRAGHPIDRVDDYDDWVRRFETALTALPEKRRAQTVLPLLHAFRAPQAPLRGAPEPTEVFHAAVRTAKVGPGDIPHLDEALIDKYIRDLREFGLI
ncbi:carboxylic acid reductase [Mycolicibacterium smegmatis]|nr:carboxylic acid reductase [Mycolicibacterium smegmatis]ABK71854.1 putative long-chain fatty-acid--CoA ligase [Mycolicibacterium smegmatis MC2 155]AIU10753.1 oxidoreductase [Mycolicibacterium smegmatis MC2 155]AIU17378.1 oxidoreductase [Mycolicibacterium smegmatis]AIU24001.1 oxidoreductase [Mycolicibacterium smegmatis]MCC3336694.1 thioester reductase domain-containing protein [Mycolicibacterium smegmatis]